MKGLKQSGLAEGEIFQRATLEGVRNELQRKLGSVPEVRPAGGKDGGVINEQACSVMDLPIDGSLKSAELERVLLTTPGISATGLFIGYDYELLT